MRQIIIGFVFGSCLSLNTHADTIERYMNIVDSLPKMDMRADKDAQTWSRSARKVLALTSESIAETLVLANQVAISRGKPLFCAPPNTTIDAEFLNQLIPKTYRESKSGQIPNPTMTVSEVALLGLTQQFPCNAYGQAAKHTPVGQFTKESLQVMQHVSADEVMKRFKP